MATAGDVLYYEYQGSNIAAARKALQQGDHGHAGGHHPLPGAAQRPVPVQRQRHHRRAPERLLRGGDADEDRLRRRLDRQQRADLQPREHAPVVGRHVSYAEPKYTFFKEGYATSRSTTSPPTSPARPPARSARDAYKAAFEASDRDPLQHALHTTSTTFWSVAPANPTTANLFTNANTYTRPGTSYIALRAILGPDNFGKASKEIQTTYRGRLDLAAARDRDLPQVDAEPVDRLLEQARRVLQAVVGHVLHRLAGGRQPAADHGPGPRRRRLL